MKVLLFGSTGQVGAECREIFSAKGWELLTPSRAEVDFSSPAAVVGLVSAAKVDFVVNACAYTAVDKAETEAQVAQSVNAESVGAMARACAARDIPLIHISTDYVFDGGGQQPYVESDAVAPLGVYGQTKLAGERLLRAALNKHLILRTSWVFSRHGNNFVKTMLRLGAERDSLSVVADQFGCPTAACDIAEVISELICRYDAEGSLPWGTYHLSDRGECSWFEFAQAIFSEAVKQGGLKRAPRLEPITTDQYPTPARRPAYSVLDCTKLERLLGRELPHWHKGLRQVLAALKSV